MELLDHMMAMEPECEMYAADESAGVDCEPAEAGSFVDYGGYKRGCRDRETPEWGYYLYLCTLIEREPSYVDKLTDEIELLFKKNRRVRCCSGFFCFCGNPTITAVQESIRRLKHGSRADAAARISIWKAII